MEGNTILLRSPFVENYGAAGTGALSNCFCSDRNSHAFDTFPMCQSSSRSPFKPSLFHGNSSETIDEHLLMCQSDCTRSELSKFEYITRYCFDVAGRCSNGRPCYLPGKRPSFVRRSVLYRYCAQNRAPQRSAGLGNPNQMFVKKLRRHSKSSEVCRLFTYFFQAMPSCLARLCHSTPWRSP
jgi:hypothetical protein